MVLIHDGIVVDMEGIAWDIDGGREIGGTLIEVHRVNLDQFALTGSQVTSPLDSTRLGRLREVAERIVNRGRGKRILALVGQHNGYVLSAGTYDMATG